MKGKFITFEGSEGSGKSTQANMIFEYLQKKNVEVMHIREPGGVKISESIREILLDVKNTKMNMECEVLLYMAARSQLIEEVIMPALESGKIVLCDRFLDSTLAYQGFGAGVDLMKIKDIGSFATKGIAPDITLLFDIDAKKGLERTGKNKDRIELRSIEYHNSVRLGYLKLAEQEPNRIKTIKVDSSKEDIHKRVCEYVNELLGL